MQPQPQSSSTSAPAVPAEFVRALDRALAEQTPEAYSALAGAFADLPSMKGKTPTPADVRRVIEAERSARRHRHTRGVSLADLAAVASTGDDDMSVGAADVALLTRAAIYESKGALHLDPLRGPVLAGRSAAPRRGERRTARRAPSRRKGSRRSRASTTAPSGGGGDPDPDGESDPDPEPSPPLDGGEGKRLCAACSEPRCKRGERTCSRCRKRAQRSRDRATADLAPTEPSETAEAAPAPRCGCEESLALPDEDGQPVCVTCGRATSPPRPWPINGYDATEALMLTYAEDDGSGGVRLRGLAELAKRYGPSHRRRGLLVTRTRRTSQPQGRAA